MSLRRFALTLAAIAVLSVGFASFVPQTYACGGHQPGGCKQEQTHPRPAPPETFLERFTGWVASLFG